MTAGKGNRPDAPSARNRLRDYDTRTFWPGRGIMSPCLMAPDEIAELRARVEHLARSHSAEHNAEASARLDEVRAVLRDAGFGTAPRQSDRPGLRRPD